MLDSRFSPQVTQNEDNGQAIGYRPMLRLFVLGSSFIGLFFVTFARRS